MLNPSGPDSDDTPDRDAETTEPADAEPVEQAEDRATGEAEGATDVFSTEASDAEPDVEAPQDNPPERRFTAPGFDAGETEVMPPVPEPVTEVMPIEPPTTATFAERKPMTIPRGQGWLMALILIVLALLAVVVLGMVWLTRHGGPKVSQEDLVRDTIENFDTAVQNGDLATLRSITCGSVRDRYVNYDEGAWNDTYHRVSAAKQYPVVASIDEVVVNGDHAEANVTAYMAFAPGVRSPRSFDLQYRDDQWKICQSAIG
jgi:Na+-transporting methylmalonyl-CoA/oxaloacetate decarboxylase gamma subunit